MPNEAISALRSEGLCGNTETGSQSSGERAGEVAELARELYNRFVPSGWEPQDAHEQISAMLNAWASSQTAALRQENDRLSSEIQELKTKLEKRRKGKMKEISGIEQIAQVCHEANRAYCQSIGDSSQPAWADAPLWQKDSAINGVKFHLTNLANGERPDPSASHESWLTEKRAAGWKYGPVKNPETKEHPCFMPYDGLPLDQRLKDYIFSAIVEAFFNAAKKEKRNEAE